MTAPFDDIIFRNESLPTGVSLDDTELPDVDVSRVEKETESYPPPIIEMTEETMQELLVWTQDWVRELLSQQSDKQNEWAMYEDSYRAQPQAEKTMPFKGASADIVPLGAMAVDPIHARLDTGIFKQDPVFTMKGLKRPILKYLPALTAFVDYYQKHQLKLRKVASPRLLECAKLGTCVFKTTYDHVKYNIKTYDVKDDYKVISKEMTKFKGPRVFGVSIGDFMFPPGFQDVQECPIIVERIRTTYNKLKIMEASKKLQGVDRIKDQELYDRTDLEKSREDASNHKIATRRHEDIVVYEIWCDYDINGDGIPESLVMTYHYETNTLLQCRYNWYFHQRKPYTVIPYSITNESLYGLGILEMTHPFQLAVTRWQQMAQDNAYIANIRMFIVKKGSGIEDVPRLYSGRCFFVDDPRADFIPFQAGDIYQSTLAERQNLFGLAEKRTGVSDYLTGRESPIIGSRATATSTLALIQEGTKRVEQVLENIRQGMAELIEYCLYIWIQYGLGEIDDIVFGDDVEMNKLLKEFFATVDADNINGAIAIDLSATDASGNRQVIQQMQLQIIQTMMTYLEKVLAAGQGALQAQASGQPQMVGMITDVMTAARAMFKDLLQKYDIRNPEDYLPDLEKYLNGGGPPGVGGPALGVGGAGGQPGLVPGQGAPTGPTPTRPATPGSGGGLPAGAAVAGFGAGAGGGNPNGGFPT